MPQSKGRKKKSKGKAWRTGRAGSEYEADSVVSAPERDFMSPSDAALAEALTAAFVDNEVYGDEELGRLLVRRGWEPVHVHFENLSDTWAWSPSDAGEGWLPTTVTVEEFGYVVDYATTDALSGEDLEDFDSREALLDSIESIESYRHPDDPRT